MRNKGFGTNSTCNEVSAEAGCSTVIGKNVTFTGDMSSEDDVDVKGHFKGSLNVDDKLVVSEGGFIEGNITADVVEVRGTVHGDIVATSLLKLCYTGSIKGDVVANKFVILEGGRFIGRSLPVESLEEEDESEEYDEQEDEDKVSEEDENSSEDKIEYLDEDDEDADDMKEVSTDDEEFEISGAEA